MERRVQTPHSIHYLKVKGTLTLDDIRHLVTTDPDNIMYFDMDKLVSRNQVEIALQRSLFFHDSGSRVKSLSSIVAMMLSGNRQIDRALSIVGLSAHTKRVMCITIGDHNLPYMHMFEPDNEGLPENVPEMDRKVFRYITEIEYHLS